MRICSGGPVVPSPLAGEGRGGGNPTPSASRVPPPLTPPHKGEGSSPAERHMILRGSDTVLVQGITGKQGTFWSERMRDYGTRIIGGVNPKRGRRDAPRPAGVGHRRAMPRATPRSTPR